MSACCETAVCKLCILYDLDHHICMEDCVTPCEIVACVCICRFPVNEGVLR